MANKGTTQLIQAERSCASVLSPVWVPWSVSDDISHQCLGAESLIITDIIDTVTNYHLHLMHK